MGLVKKLLKSSTLVLATGTLLMVSANDGTKYQKKTPPLAPRSTFSVQDGPSDFYKKNCASCHGIDGTGIGPLSYNFDKNVYRGKFKIHRPFGLGCPGFAAGDFKWLKKIVTEGKYCPKHGLIMPAFPNIPDEQVEQLRRDFRYFRRLHGH